jgi:hypothetical protein
MAIAQHASPATGERLEPNSKKPIIPEITPIAVLTPDHPLLITYRQRRMISSAKEAYLAVDNRFKWIDLSLVEKSLNSSILGTIFDIIFSFL